MAAPHVGGTAALYHSSNTEATPANVEEDLKVQVGEPTDKKSKNGAQIRLVDAEPY
jgi:hypothetical protein